jgi:hypothetical protein
MPTTMIPVDTATSTFHQKKVVRASSMDI